MAGLLPASHDFHPSHDVDARDKRGHDKVLFEASP